MITPEGDYLSNLQAPDLRQYFKHLHWRQMGHSMGHLVASDWADKADDDPVFGIYKKCGLWTRDEAAILYTIARRTRASVWGDIGCHTGWTSAHIGTGGQDVYAVDPMLGNEEFNERFIDNNFDQNPEVDYDIWNKSRWNVQVMGHHMTSSEFFADAETDWVDGVSQAPDYFSGFVIDGDHEPGSPLQDAQNAYKHLADTGVLIFHDFIGGPVREAVTWLMDQGFKARVYWTPHLVACCWRDDFEPPVHEPDKRINWYPHMLQMKRDFDFGRLS